jgi:hypothetical protein
MSIITPAIARPQLSTKDGAPYISRISKGEKSSDYELIRKIRSRYNNAWNAKTWEFEQMIECWKFYFGAIGEMWDEDAIRYKIERHMRVAQYNIIRDKVRTMTGMLGADEYTGRYDPITGGRNSGIESMEFAYDCNRELMDYDDQYWQVILDGLVHVGTLGVSISYAKDPRGVINFPREMPGRWFTDPGWVSNSIYDCMIAWKQGHMTARQILDLDPDAPMEPQLRDALTKEEEIPRNYDEPSLDTYDTAFPHVQGTYHVIEEHWIEVVKTKRLIGRTEDGEWIPFPIVNDNEALEQFAMANGIASPDRPEDWQDNVDVVPYEDHIAHLDRICPELSPYKLRANGKASIQVKSVPIVQFSYDKDMSGRNLGMVNDAIDPQKDLNYAKSKRQELLASAQGGAGVYNKNVMPDEGDQQDFESNHNDTTRMFGVQGDPTNFVKRIQDGAYAPELIKETEEPFNIVDRILGVSAAMSSRTQGANEPASLFAMKLKVNKIGTLPLDKRLKMLRNWQYQSFFFQAQIEYAGPEREFSSKSGKKTMKINERLPDGTIRNKIDEIPLCSVTIDESEGSLSRQLRDRTEIAAMLQAIPKEYREPIAIMIDEAFKTMDLSEDKKEMVSEAMQIEILKARLASITEISKIITEGKGAKTQGIQADMASIQLEAQLKQMMAGLMPQQPQAPTPQMVSRVRPGMVRPGSMQPMAPSPNAMQQIRNLQ